jgi:hypothetical protein
MGRGRMLPAALGAALLAACAAVESPARSAPAASPAVQSSPEPMTLGAGETDLDPGTYRLDLTALDAGADTYPPFRVTVPDGWVSMDGWALARPASGQDAPSVAVTFWDVDEVYADSCRWQGTERDPGPGVADLVDALAFVPDRRPTVPEPVEIDGYAGTYLEWTVPRDVAFDEEGNFPDCDGDDAGHHDFRSWTGSGWASTRYHQGPGQVDRLWVLDVGGQRLVIDAFSMPSATPDEIEELRAIVDSIRFDD